MKLRNKRAKASTVLKVGLLALGLSACGGGGGGSTPAGSTGDVTQDGTTTAAPITKSNYKTVAKFGYGLVGFSESVAQRSNVMNNPIGSSTARSTIRGVTSDAATCKDGGSGSMVIKTAVENRVSNGDSYSGTFNHCRNDYPSQVGGYVLMDGKYVLTYSNVVGDYFFSDSGSMTIQGEYDTFTFGGKFSSSPAFNIVFDGTLAYELQKTATTHYVTMTADSFTFGSTHDGKLLTYAMTDLDIETIGSLTDGTQTTTGRYDVDVTTNPNIFSGSFAITYNIQGLSDHENYSSGTVTIHDKHSAAIVIVTILSESLIEVALDENGDGTPEETNTFTTEELEG